MMRSRKEETEEMMEAKEASKVARGQGKRGEKGKSRGEDACHGGRTGRHRGAKGLLLRSVG